MVAARVAKKPPKKSHNLLRDELRGEPLHLAAAVTSHLQRTGPASLQAFLLPVTLVIGIHLLPLISGPETSRLFS